MAEWLQYLTSDKPTALTAERARNGHPAPWKIAYFAVGNETWGCGGNMTLDHYVNVFRQYATFLKTPAGARPIILASGGHDEDTSWTEGLVSKGGADVGAVSFHYYTIPGEHWRSKGPAVGFGADQWISTLAHTLQMEEFVRANTALMDKYDPQKKVGFAVDEWGTWYDPETGREPGFLYQQNTLRDAVVAALNLNIFHQHAERVRMTSIAQMVNVLQAMILTQGSKMVLTPTYHVFHMFRPFRTPRSCRRICKHPATRSATHPFQRSAFRQPGLPRAPSSLRSSIWIPARRCRSPCRSPAQHRAPSRVKS